MCYLVWLVVHDSPELRISTDAAALSSAVLAFPGGFWVLGLEHGGRGRVDELNRLFEAETSKISECVDNARVPEAAAIGQDEIRMWPGNSTCGQQPRRSFNEHRYGSHDTIGVGSSRSHR